MSLFHCECGFAINEAEEFGDHLRAVFDRGDDTGTDGIEHYERADTRVLSCACGFQPSDTAEFDDHVLLALIPPDGTGADGRRHIPVDHSTPERWYVRDDPDD